MKNKTILITFAVLAILLSAGFASADGCNPTINLVNQDPTPAIPNSYVKVQFEVSNLLGCNGFAVKLDPQYPFSLDSGVDPVQTIVSSPYAQNYKPTWTVPYTIRVANDALEGDYNLGLLYHDSASKDFSTVSVENEFNITVTDVQTDFQTVLQGFSGTQASIGIVNTGKNTANSLVVSIPSQNNFIPIGTSEQIVGNLVAGDYSIVSFSVAPRVLRNSTRTSTGTNFGAGQQFGEQNLSIKIDYTDSIGERRTVIKEVQIASTLLSQGNITNRAFGTGSRTAATSGTSPIIYLIIVVLILALGALVYKKHGKEIEKFYEKKMGKKALKGEPDWVSAERTRKR